MLKNPSLKNNPKFELIIFPFYNSLLSYNSLQIINSDLPTSDNTSPKIFVDCKKLNNITYNLKTVNKTYSVIQLKEICRKLNIKYTNKKDIILKLSNIYNC